MNNEQDKKSTINNNSFQKSSEWNMQFLQKKRLALKQQHEKRKRTEQLAQEQLKKSKRIPNEQQNPYRNSSKNIPNVMQNQPRTDQYNYHHTNQLNNFQNNIPHDSNEMKKIGVQEILRDGRIVKIIQRTLTHDEYKVQCFYEGQMMELIASKEEIVKNNIIPLLDFYEKVLGLR